MPRSDSLPRIPTRAPLDHRHVVKFVYSESSKSMGSTSKVIDLGNCSSGVQILETVLKKFGIQAKAMGDMDGDDDQLEVGGWGVYIEDERELRSDHHQLTLAVNRALSDSRLLDVCHDPEWSHERGRQLILRRRIQANRKNMGQYLGDSPPPSLSPNALSHFTVVRSGSGTEESRANNKKVNRASMVSIMSGLDPSPSSSTARAPSVGTTKMPGFRPPSELISTHLAQYFPSARKRDLEKTVRQSMLRLSQGDRQALRSLGTSSPFSASVESVSSPNRRGRPPSTRTVSSSTILEEEETGDEASTTESHPPLLPPFESSGVSLVDSFQEYQPGPSFRNTIHPGRSSSRISVLSTPRNRSDSTSLLTVDEITAEVENRRSSLATTLSPTDSLASDEELTDWESDEEEDEEDEDEVEAEVGRNHHALTSNGCKWLDT
jgi:mitogen-activated protein kinase kinase kinase